MNHQFTDICFITNARAGRTKENRRISTPVILSRNTYILVFHDMFSPLLPRNYQGFSQALHLRSCLQCGQRQVL